jgi:transposase
VLASNVWRRTLGVDRATVIESVEFDEEASSVVIHVRPRRPKKRRCGLCGRRSSGYDRGQWRHNWRAIDLGVTLCYLQADAPRVNCPSTGWRRSHPRLRRSGGVAGDPHLQVGGR